MCWKLLVLTISCSYAVAQMMVVQDDSVSASVGQNTHVTCRWNTGSVTGNNWPDWIYQTPGSVPRLVVGSSSTSNPNYRPSWTPDRFTGSITESAARLTINNLQPEDDGVYYCFLWTGTAYIIGPGTYLAVNTGDVKAPSVSVFIPSVEELETDKATLACTLSDFTPKMVTVEWMVDGMKQTTGVYPSMASKQENNLYMTSSVLTMTAEQYKNHEKFSCKVTHQGKEIIKTINRSECA
ncbi:immunoglobulin lambda-1 light chain-like [Leptodactylus fuscus]